MIEKPMLFSGATVKAILEGRKTQTRRAVKPQPEYEGRRSFGDSWKWKNGKDWFSGVTTCQLTGTTGLCHADRVPHPVGSQIWVKETWFDSRYESKKHPITYRADWAAEDETDRGFQWKPSIFMPRWASRITLEVTGVRVERLKNISEADALAEGVSIGPCVLWKGASLSEKQQRAVDVYEAIWDSINGKKYPWSSNPWVWVYEFKVIQKPED